MSADQHQDCRRQEDANGCGSCPQYTCHLVPDEGRADQNWAWRDLAQCNTINKFFGCDPSVAVDDDLLYHRNEYEASAKQQDTHAGECN